MADSIRIRVAYANGASHTWGFPSYTSVREITAFVSTLGAPQRLDVVAFAGTVGDLARLGAQLHTVVLESVH